MFLNLLNLLNIGKYKHLFLYNIFTYSYFLNLHVFTCKNNHFAGSVHVFNNIRADTNTIVFIAARISRGSAARISK